MNYSIAITEENNELLKKHLIRTDGQEDLCFALYNTTTGFTRTTAIIKEIIFPGKGDRSVHGNVSFTSQYYDRVSAESLKKRCGICFIHSHPSSGWQGMSYDDIEAEKMLSPRVKAVTSLPLVGMTLSNDFIWSARFWIKEGPKIYGRHFCAQVRVSGKKLHMSYYDELYPKYFFGAEFTRTISAWGSDKQANLARLKVGIVGLGSVGSIIAETLVRTGIKNITLIDFDIVEEKNLDRLQGLGRSSVGKHKVIAIQEYLRHIAVDKETNILALPFSIAEKEGIQAALDCDVLFSCVDRPWARFILNCLSYANFIPIIDGGIEANPNKKGDNIDQARWKAHTIGPGRSCLLCIGQYRPEDVALEQSGLLEDPHYIKNLPNDHFVNRGENVFAFSIGLAGIEMQQFLSLSLQPRNQYCGPKEYNFNSGNIDSDFPFNCKDDCEYSLIAGDGDKINHTLIARHKLAEDSRRIGTFNSNLKISGEKIRVLKKIKKMLTDFFKTN